LLGGWRPVFRWSGLVVLGFALVWIAAAGWVSRRDDHDSDGWTDRTNTESDASKADGGTGTESAPEAGTIVRSIGADLKQVSTHPEMRLLVLVGAMYLFTLHGLQNWLAVVLEARGVAPPIAAGMATLFVAARAFGTLSIPPLSDLLSHRRGAVIVCGVLTAIGVLGLLRSGTGLVLTDVVIALVGIGSGDSAR
jgi:hypothetical protein